MAEQKPSKLLVRVRFPLSAPFICYCCRMHAYCHGDIAAQYIKGYQKNSLVPFCVADKLEAQIKAVIPGLSAAVRLLVMPFLRDEETERDRQTSDL